MGGITLRGITLGGVTSQGAVLGGPLGEGGEKGGLGGYHFGGGGADQVGCHPPHFPMGAI